MRLDSALEFQPHYKDLCTKLNSASFVIKKLGTFLPTSCLRHLYFAYYYSHLTYGLPIWWNLLKLSHQNVLLQMQKRILRAICKASYTQHCMPLFKKQRILTVSDQYLLDLYKLVRRITTNEIPVALEKLTVRTSQKSVYNARMSIACAIKSNTNKIRNSFLCKPIMEWQKLNNELKKYENYKLFGKKVKESLLKKY